MGLSVIGAGLGRTGTASLKCALEQLGFGPCYRLENVMASSTGRSLWERATDNEVIDWDEVFAGYRSTTDIPGSFFFKELSVKYPAAKVILTVREANAWYESTQEVVDPATAALSEFPIWPLMQKLDAKLGKLVSGLEPIKSPREHALAMFERYNATVRTSITADRLLVFDVRQGWKPLCEFLGVPIPSTAFPRAFAREVMPRDEAAYRSLWAKVHAGSTAPMAELYESGPEDER